jgi:hypothetical protein
MSNHEELVDKLLAQGAGERACGNHEAADSFELKAANLRSKYNLPAPQPVKQDAEADRRRQVQEKWEKLPASAQAIIELLEPGMRRTTQRVTTMEVALPLLKAETARFVRLVDGNNEITFAPQEVGKGEKPCRILYV